MAKRRGIALVLVGHVTKEGLIAGPRVLEHMVDTVLHFEGERGNQFRVMRAVKNRFGPTDEIGVFEMTDAGLREVPNPSVLFLADRDRPVSGASVFAGMEGTRPLLVEIQSLTAPSALATPRRAVVGWDGNRLAMVLAVLQTRCGVDLLGRDVYLNVAGGLRISEPAADMAVAASLVSALSEQPLPAETVVFGEISLSGEVRSVAHMEPRLKEAAKLGFTRAVVPTYRTMRDRTSLDNLEIRLIEIGHLSDLTRLAATTAIRFLGDGPSNGSGKMRSMEPNSPISWIDVAVGGVLVISALLAFTRGVMHEALSIIPGSARRRQRSTAIRS